jgi:hypothetical protein
MKTATLLVAAICSMSAMRGQTEHADETVTVYLTNNTMAPFTTVCPAMHLAARMFEHAGVRIRWRRGQPKNASDSRDRALVVRLEDRTPANRRADVLGVTTPQEGVHITVFYDRVRRLSSSEESSELLAFVLVHEITHALQGESRHAETGIMKARWKGRDYYEIARDPFTQQDVDLIHRGLAAHR